MISLNDNIFEWACEHRVCATCRDALFVRSYECPLCRAPRRDGAERVPEPPEHHEPPDPRDFAEQVEAAVVVLGAPNDEDMFDLLDQALEITNNLPAERRAQVLQFVSEAYGGVSLRPRSSPSPPSPHFHPPASQMQVQPEMYLSADERLHQHLMREVQRQDPGEARREGRRQGRASGRAAPTVMLRGMAQRGGHRALAFLGVDSTGVDLHRDDQRQPRRRRPSTEALPNWYVPFERRTMQRSSTAEQTPVQFLAEFADEVRSNRFRGL